MTAITRTRKFELTLFKPKSEDATESQPLEQLEDAGQTFVVTTERTDSRPYLGIPEGRRGRIQVPDRKVDSASIGVRVLDRQDGGNLERWVTKFSGNSQGQNQFAALKAQIREWNSETASWEEFFTGRVFDSGLKDSKLWYQFQLRDLVDELKTRVFVGPPHPSVSYAQASPLLPVGGPMEAWGSIPATPWLKGKGSERGIGVDPSEWKAGRNIVTRALHEVVTAPGQHPQLPLGLELPTPRIHTSCRVRCKITSGPRTGEEGEFWLARTISRVVTHVLPTPTALHVELDDKGHWRVKDVGLYRLPVTHPDYMEEPPIGDSVEFYLYRYGEPTPDAPLLIGPVHPAKLIRDLLAGLFGPQQEVFTVDPLITFPAAAAEFDLLEQDTSIPPVSLVVDKPRDLKATIEQLNLSSELAYRVTGAGVYEPIDWRLTSDSIAGLVDLVDEDLVPGKDSVKAPDKVEDAVTVVELTHYADRIVPIQDLEALEGIPDVPPLLVESAPIPNHTFFAGYGQLSEKKVRIDAIGIREIVTTSTTETTTSQAARRRIEAVTNSFRSPYGRGPRIYTLRFRRTPNVETCVEGSLRRLNISAISDPATNRRGGPRLARCIERSPGRGAAEVYLTLLDLGADSVALPPSVGAVGQNAADPRNAVDVPVTLNAAGEPAVIHFAVAETGTAVRPSESSELWTYAARLAEAGTVTIDSLPAGKRIWLRARTEPGETSQPKIPSAWAFPAAESVDTQALPAPTNLQLSVVGRSIVATCTPGDDDLPLMPIIAVDPGPAEDALESPLPAESQRYVFGGLGAGTYVAGFKHVDGFGGESPALTQQATTDPELQLVAPRRVQIRAGRTTELREGELPEGQTIGYGLWIGFGIREPVARHRIQVSEDPGFASLEAEVLLDAGVRLHPVFLPRRSDDPVWYVRIRAELEGYTDSAWSAVVSSLATVLTPTPTDDGFPGGFAELDRRANGEVLFTVGHGGDPDTERAYYEWVVNPPSEGDYPDVTTASEYVERVNMPFTGTLDDGGIPLNVDTGDLVLLHVRFWSAVSGFGQSTFVPFRALDVKLGRARLRALVGDETADYFLLFTSPDPDVYPVSAEIWFDAPTGAADVTHQFNGDAEIGPANYAALDDVALPNKEARRCWATCTDARGNKYDAFTMADRDPYPLVEVSVEDFQDNPPIRCACDDDTEQVRVTTPSGVKTFVGLSGGGVVTYTVGDLLDGGGSETFIHEFATRTGYMVEGFGGGEWKEFWNGDLHGEVDRWINIVDWQWISAGGDSSDAAWHLKLSLELGSDVTTGVAIIVVDEDDHLLASADYWYTSSAVNHEHIVQIGLLGAQVPASGNPMEFTSSDVANFFMVTASPKNSQTTNGDGDVWPTAPDRDGVGARVESYDGNTYHAGRSRVPDGVGLNASRDTDGQILYEWTGRLGELLTKQGFAGDGEVIDATASGAVTTIQGYVERASSGAGVCSGLGAYGVASHASGTVSQIRGVSSTVELTGAGDLDFARAFVASVGVTGSGTIAEAAGLVVGGFFKTAGAITTIYGVKVEQQTNGATNWAFYAAGATKSYFGGGFGVGHTNAATTLGNVARKMEIYNSAGASLGFVPLYDTIT